MCECYRQACWWMGPASTSDAKIWIWENADMARCKRVWTRRRSLGGPVRSCQHVPPALCCNLSLVMTGFKILLNGGCVIWQSTVSALLAHVTLNDIHSSRNPESTHQASLETTSVTFQKVQKISAGCLYQVFFFKYFFLFGDFSFVDVWKGWISFTTHKVV